MPLNAQSTWALLRELDDPDHLTFPRGYNQTTAKTKFNQLAANLNVRFDCLCVVDTHVQDASYHGTIIIPSAATASGEHITVTVSNFGDLAVATLGNPGSYDEEEERELFHGDDRRSVEEELEALGYHSISEHLLWAPYDGVSVLHTRDRPCWWTRFFDYHL